MLKITQAHLHAMQGTYEVKPGDTLSAIASLHGLALHELIDLNPQIEDPNLIHPGQVIQIDKNTGSKPTATQPKKPANKSAGGAEQNNQTVQALDGDNGAADNSELIQACLYKQGDNGQMPTNAEPVEVNGVPVTTEKPINPDVPLAHVIMPIPGTTDPLNTKDLPHQANGSYWHDTQLLEQLISIDEEGRNITLNHGYFSWSGDNSKEARGQNSQDVIVDPTKDAGQRLKQLLYARDNKPFYEGMKDKPLNFHFIGHSHGGNVMNEFSHAIKKDFPPLWKIKSLTYLSTPFFNQLHPLDGTHLHDDAKVILVHNDYDITQHTIANYTVINLEDIETLLPLLKDFFKRVQNDFAKTFEQIVDFDNLFIFAEHETTTQRWKRLGEHINGTATQLESRWQSFSEQLKDYQRLIPFTLIDFFDQLLSQYADWASLAQNSLDDQANQYEQATEEQRNEKDYFNLKSLYAAAQLPTFLRIISSNLGTSAAKSPLFGVLDDIIAGIISIFDDTLLVPEKWPDELTPGAVHTFDVTNKDPYHQYGQTVFTPFLQALENNQNAYKDALISKNLSRQKSLRQELLLLLIAQFDYSLLKKIATGLDRIQWGVFGELDTAVGELKDNVQWVLGALDRYHVPLMVSDDLLLHYCMNYQKEEAQGDSDDLKEWLEDNVLVDQERLLKRLKQIVCKGRMPLSQLKTTIEKLNDTHTYLYEDNRLNWISLRGSIEYLAITAHSISRQALYEKDPNIKGTLVSCLKDG